MKGDQDVIDALNGGLTIELTAINLYFVHAKMARNWGVYKLGKHFYDESIEEMHHAEWLIDRVLFLDGVPEIARYDVIRVGNDIPAQLQNALDLELKAVRTYNDGIRLAMDRKDAGSKDLMEKILVQSEESVDWLEAQLNLIQVMGLENYLTTQVGDEESLST
jgi:bacterioferritin